MALTQKYLLDHAGTVENYETIGRKLAALILRAAAESDSVKAGSSAESIDLQLTAKLTQNVPLLCVDVQVCAPIVGCTTIHVGAS